MNVAMFTDLYELTMAQAYLREGMQQPAVFELFFRKLPDCRNFIVAAGLESVLERLEELRFTSDDLDYLREQGQFGADFLDYLKDFRFTGDVDALAEGTVVFPHEPLVQVVAPLPMAQIIETLVLNQVHFASLVAAKAARIVLAAGGERKVVDFGSRRGHGIDAALTMARATYLVGAAGTSLVLAGQRYGIPILGTMAHSYIQAHDDELESFRAFVKLYPDTTLLVDTYDTLDGVRKVIDLQEKLGDDFRVQAIRLDSGDLDQLARDSRRLLDEAGLQDVTIFASGGLDEYKLRDFDQAGTPIDGYGVGTALAVSDDAPSLDMAYKLVEYDGGPRTKLSSSKVIYPGRKQVLRRCEADQMAQDVVALHDESHVGEPLLQPVMRQGERLSAGRVSLEQSREHAREQLRKLPPALCSLAAAESPYPVEISAGVQRSLDQFQRSHAQSKG
ncbi:MAG: nicotinate phosphoribosyltransferase [Pirellulaceae bacterium]